MNTGVEILVRGLRSMENLVITEVDAPALTEQEQTQVDDTWAKVLEGNPKAFPGPTLRFNGFDEGDDRLCMHVSLCNYKQSMVVGWLGVAMLPITSDGILLMQGPVPEIGSIIGAGRRVAGCTPPDSDISACICREMYEEFGVRIKLQNVQIHGLIAVTPPAASCAHHGLVVSILLAENLFSVFRAREKAADKWEGVLIACQLDEERVRAVADDEKYAPTTREIVRAFGQDLIRRHTSRSS